MIQRYVHVLFTVVFVVLVFLQCSKTTTDPETADVGDGFTWELMGTWVGTHFEFVSQADTSVKADLSSYGVAYSIVINADSTYSSTTAFLGQTMIETGTLRVTDTEITLYPVNDQSHSGTYTKTETQINIVITDEGFDFDQDGTDEPAFLYIDLVKS